MAPIFYIGCELFARAGITHGPMIDAGQVRSRYHVDGSWNSCSPNFNRGERSSHVARLVRQNIRADDAAD